MRAVLGQSDKIRESFSALQAAGKRASDETVGLRREVRRLTGDVVHATDLEGGAKKLPEIQRLGAELLQSLEKDKASGGSRR